MAIRTVRLDSDAEATLRQIREATGLPISEVLKQGLRSFQQQVRSRQHPYELYDRLDLGPGGYASAPFYRDAARCGYRLGEEAAEMILFDPGPLIALFDSRGESSPSIIRTSRLTGSAAVTGINQ